MKTFNWFCSGLILLLVTLLFYSNRDIQSTDYSICGQSYAVWISLMIYLQVGVFISAFFLLIIYALQWFHKKKRGHHAILNIGLLLALILLIPILWLL